MNTSPSSSDRVTVDGKFFRIGSRKFHIKGVTYGPFAPDANGETFGTPERAELDFKRLTELAANTIRVYYVPPRWLLDLAQAHQLRVLVDIPWPKHLCFLDSKRSQKEARATVRRAVSSCGGHPAILGYSVVNEISAEIVRWSGVARVEKFIDDLIGEAKDADPGGLCTFASFPPTEFLRPDRAEFVCFNIYLHEKEAFESYLASLQTQADARPLVLGEFGMDSIREGEARKSAFLGWQIESAFRAGLAGTVVFSFTDDWFRGGSQIEDWGFGLTRRDRAPKESFKAVQQQYRVAPYYPLARFPRVSVVIATFNGARTLTNALESVTRLNYPDYEVILVDDGSVDTTPEIAARFASVRYLRQENMGLSAARNAGIRAATGEIVAFTDDDCRADEDWLYYLVGDLQRWDSAGIGGHNLLPPEDSSVAAAVVVSPGGPAHVMLSDTEAEHIPGCNMAFYKWALEEIGMFDPIYRKAGDDVDVCWRIQDCNHRIGFSPAGFVWHYRRSTLKAYFKQQAGYGEAEALLMRKHPEHYNSFGGGIWRGQIYAASRAGLLLQRAVIYHGIFGSGFFQRLYSPTPASWLLLCTSLAYHAFVNVPLLLLAANYSVFLPLAVASLGTSAGACLLAAAQARLPRDRTRFWSRPLVALLFFCQPVVRGWARFKWRLNLLSERRLNSALPIPRKAAGDVPEQLAYWGTGATDRYGFLRLLLSKLDHAGWPCRTDTGWQNYDLEVTGRFWSRVKLTTVSESLDQGRLNVRCRIRGSWSLPAKAVSVLLAAGLAVLIPAFAEQAPWTWLSLSILPLVFWWFDDERRATEEALSLAIDETAKDLALIRI